uniref:ISXO2-like transposase domain-containing protein n=1 Tax=Plectus sambesii TaxID=2011161 RepID=A0A914URJ1_9BILA
MLCNKCMPLDALPGEGELQEMKRVVRDGEIRLRCYSTARRKRAANGRGQLGPGDQQEPHRGNATEQAAVADDAAIAQEEAAHGNVENIAVDEAENAEDNDRAEGWVFGLCWWRSRQEKVNGIPNETRFFAVRDRTAATLLNLIQNHIAPGSQIWSDCWRSYARIAQLPEQYTHHTVNHSEDFTNRVSGVNTNAIKAAWNRLGHKIVRTKRGVGKELRYHLAELWWKSLQRVPVTGGNQHKTKTHPHIFMNFLNLISRMYPL